MAKEIPPVLDILKNFGKQVATAAIENAAEGVLDEFQGVLRKADSHIAGARGRAAERRRERARAGEQDPEIAVTVVESETSRKRKKRA
jgi:hypothetical protein